MESLDEELDLQLQKINNLEMNIVMMQENISILSESLKETQRYLVKLANSQMELTRRLSSWPYIKVPKENKGE